MLLGGGRERTQGLLSPAGSYVALATEQLHAVLHGFPGGQSEQGLLPLEPSGPRKTYGNKPNGVWGGDCFRKRPWALSGQPGFS